jgi:hypothetical protein
LILCIDITVEPIIALGLVSGATISLRVISLVSFSKVAPSSLWRPCHNRIIIFGRRDLESTIRWPDLGGISGRTSLKESLEVDRDRNDDQEEEVDKEERSDVWRGSEPLDSLAMNSYSLGSLSSRHASNISSRTMEMHSDIVILGEIG